jgi:hypothetical protein
MKAPTLDPTPTIPLELIRRLELCAAYDGVTLIDLLEGLADDLELQQEEPPERLSKFLSSMSAQQVL